MGVRITRTAALHRPPYPRPVPSTQHPSPNKNKKGVIPAAMAHIDRRDRNGAVRYVARYIDPTGCERSKSFTRRADAHKT